MHELHLRGEETADGLAFETFPGTNLPLIRIAGTSYMLAVEKNRIIAFDKDGAFFAGQQLVGAELPVLQKGTPIFNITIDGVREIDFPVKPNGELLEVYQMNWYIPNQWPAIIGKGLCETPDVYDDKNDLLGMKHDETLVFTGDRVDRYRLEIQPDNSQEWLNFGCAGQTLAKLQLTRNTTSTEGDWRGNQATLKMLAGDYCGKGISITAHGTPLLWKGGYLGAYIAPVSKLEARWTENGAKCINALRLDFFPSPLIPEPWKMLKATCQVDACSDADVEDLGGGLRVSAIPL